MNRNEQIETLEAHLTDAQAKYLNLDVWDKLPTEEQFEDWLPEFFEVWDTPEEVPGENTDEMCRAIAKLDEILDN
ncbi:hypothetical protein [Mobiluncus curtisii]|uniref:hypothetical protein n=1 Tax=Mobiluncus curtisii TaxID=2051 RepID=UPI00242E096C|nr:hypothetical protein [Mobiluncus curtisii]